MIEVCGWTNNNSTAYTISFYRNKFLLSSGIEEKSLSNFSVKNQQLLGKTQVKIDLNHLSLVENMEKINYVLINRYQDMLILPYLCRKNPNIKIIVTKLAYELGKVHLETFYNVIKSIDWKYSTLKKEPTLEYFQQSEVKDNYERQFNIKIDSMPSLYSMHEIKETLSKCTKINFRQELNLDPEVMLKAFPSGETMGSSNWLITSLTTKQSLFWANYISSESFKSVKHSTQIQIGIPITHFLINSSLFSELISLKTAKENSQEVMKQFTEKVGQTLQNERVCKIIQENELSVLDYLGELNWNLNGKYRQLFIDHSRMNHMVNYCNSYVQYLADGFKNRIYMDPPEYPFQNYYSLQEKMMLWTGSLQEIAEKQKLPLKELVTRSKPYIHIVPSFKAYLFDLIDQKCLLNPLKGKIKLQDILVMLKKIETQNIYFFCPGMNEWETNWKRLQFNQIYRLGKVQERFLKLKNFNDSMLCKFETITGQIFVTPVTKEYMKISKNWRQQLLLALSQKGIFSMLGSSLEQQCLQIGEKTTVWIKNYQLFIKTDEIQLLKVIEESMGTISKKLKFN